MIPLVMSVIAKTETFQQNMANAGRSVNKFGTTTSRTTTMVTKLGRSLMMMAGVGGGIYMLQRSLRGMRASVEEFAAFEQGMAKVSTMLNEQTMKYLPAYGKEIRKMSTEYGTSLTDMTEGLYKILSGQIDASEAMNVLRESVESAKGGFASTADTVQATIRILNAYGMELGQVNKVQDTLHATVNKGLLDFSELAQNIGNALGIAAPLGSDLEAVAAVMAVLTNTTQDADEAVTSLKNIFNQLKYPSLEQIEIAKGLGFVMDENSVKGAGLITVIEGLQKASAKDLSILMPTIRGYAGFSTALKKAGDVRAYYNFILNSTGLKEANLAKSMATTSTQIDIAKRKYGELRIVIGEELAPAFVYLMDIMNKAAASGEFAAKIHENIAVSYEFADALTNLDEIFSKIAPKKWGGKTYGDLAAQHRMMAGVERARGEQPELDKKVAAMKKKQQAAIEAAQKKMAVAGAGAGTRPMGMSDEAMKAELDMVKEHVASIRSMDTKTRMEKIQNLKTFQMAHADMMRDMVGKETEAGKLIRQEIDSLLSARVNAMAVYSAELREDMEWLALYTSEKFAEASRSIESGLSGAFLSLKEKGADLNSFLASVFTSIGDSFARMVADMMARAAMAAAVQPLISGLSAGLGGLFGGGAAVGAGGQPFTPSNPYGLATVPVRHTGWVPTGVPSFQRGRGLKSNEMAAIIEKDEMLVPNKQIVKSDGGGQVVNNYYISAVDTQSFQQALAKNRNFLGDLNYAGLKSNSPSRKFKQ